MVVQCEILIEGVETEEELEFVKMAGIELCQGFLFHRPLPGEVVCQLLAEQHKMEMQPGHSLPEVEAIA